MSKELSIIKKFKKENYSSYPFPFFETYNQKDKLFKINYKKKLLNFEFLKRK